MSTALIIIAIVLPVVLVALALAARWFARSWEVADDDKIDGLLWSEGEKGRSSLWLNMAWWFGRKPRQLTYRRDERGRFRRYRR